MTQFRETTALPSFLTPTQRVCPQADAGLPPAYDIRPSIVCVDKPMPGCLCLMLYAKASCLSTGRCLAASNPCHMPGSNLAAFSPCHTPKHCVQLQAHCRPPLASSAQPPLVHAVCQSIVPVDSQCQAPLPYYTPKHHACSEPMPDRLQSLSYAKASFLSKVNTQPFLAHAIQRSIVCVNKPMPGRL